jgi:hypothetical protein
MPLKSMKIFLHRQIDVSQIHQKEAKNKSDNAFRVSARNLIRCHSLILLKPAVHICLNQLRNWFDAIMAKNI